MVKRIHEAAVADERDTYVDPASGYTVFTSRCSPVPGFHHWPTISIGRSCLAARRAGNADSVSGFC